MLLTANMKQSNQYPKISAQFFTSPNNKEEYFLFNTASNKGFALDGFAALLCRKFTGEHDLNHIIKEFEEEQKLEKDEFKEEIEHLLSELEKHRLIDYFSTSQLRPPEKK